MVLFTMLVKFLCADFPFSAELQALGMGFQGAMAVRNGPNRDGRMHFFHAFALSTILGFGGGWMGFIWMGRPTSMITNGDVNITACIIAFAIANYTPNDIGFRLGNSLPVIIVTTVFSQLFRCMGLVKFISVAFNEVPPSPYYPIPVLGPILYGTMLGNMGSFLIKGFDGHLRGGIPWPFQNGKHLYSHHLTLFCCRVFSSGGNSNCIVFSHFLPLDTHCHTYLPQGFSSELSFTCLLMM